MTEAQAEASPRELKGVRLLLRSILVAGVLIYASNTNNAR